MRSRTTLGRRLFDRRGSDEVVEKEKRSLGDDTSSCSVFSVAMSIVMS